MLKRLTSLVLRRDLAIPPEKRTTAALLVLAVLEAEVLALLAEQIMVQLELLILEAEVVEQDQMEQVLLVDKVLL